MMMMDSNPPKKKVLSVNLNHTLFS